MVDYDNETGEVQETAPVPVSSLSPEVFTHIAQAAVSKEQAELLLGDVDPAELDILPTGEVYYPQVKYRQKLNQVFGPGGWAMRPLSPPYVKDELAMQEWALYANGGQFISYAVGGADYYPSNQRMNWSDVLETAKSNALMRLCKDLGIASVCWERSFTNQFKADHCVQVWRKGEKRPQWRRADVDPWYDETGIVEAKDEFIPPPAVVRQQQAKAKDPAAKGKVTDPMTAYWAQVKAVGRKDGKIVLEKAGGDPTKALELLEGDATPWYEQPGSSDANAVPEPVADIEPIQVDMQALPKNSVDFFAYVKAAAPDAYRQAPDLFEKIGGPPSSKEFKDPGKVLEKLVLAFGKANVPYEVIGVPYEVIDQE